MKIVIYTKSLCPNCVTSKRLMQENGLGYVEIDVERYPMQLSALLKQYPEARQMPQIFVDGARIGGLAGLQAYLPQLVKHVD